VRGACARVTGVNVWTFAENLAQGWLGRGGAWPPLRDLLDGLGRAADHVLDELRREDSGLAQLVEAAVGRAMITAETAVGGVLADRLRTLETEMVKAETERTDKARSDTGKFLDSPTVPHLRAKAPADVPAPDVSSVLEAARRRAHARPAGGSGAGDRALYARAIDHAHHVASASTGNTSDPALAAREFWDVRTLDEAGVTPLFDALDQARTAHIEAVRQAAGGAPAQAAAMRRIAAAYQRLSAGVAGLVVESVAPAAEHLRTVVRETARLRAQVSKNEARIAELERAFATVVDPPGAAPPSPPPGANPLPSIPGARRRRNSKETERS
jgi:hypothetical protein